MKKRSSGSSGKLPETFEWPQNNSEWSEQDSERQAKISKWPVKTSKTSRSTEQSPKTLKKTSKKPSAWLPKTTKGPAKRMEQVSMNLKKSLKRSEERSGE